jgi:glycosyltransferase involved in cell wall biosynthesis
MQTDPKISIVTVVLNDSERFYDTASNIAELSYENIEYIVIDGGSSDETLNVIDSFKDGIDVYLSEHDEGLYHAMNKGIELATGEWIIFMNAGDKFENNKVLKTIFKARSYEDFDILYGDVNVSYSGFQKFEPAGEIIDIKKGMQFCHQCALIRLSYHKNYNYNIQHKICADFDFFYNATTQNISFLKLDEIIANVTSLGISDLNREIVYCSWWKIVGFNNLTLNLIYAQRILIAFLKRIIKYFLPRKIVEFTIKLKNLSKISS